MTSKPAPRFNIPLRQKIALLFVMFAPRASRHSEKCFESNQIVVGLKTFVKVWKKFEEVSERNKDGERSCFLIMFVAPREVSMCRRQKNNKKEFL